MPTKQEKTIKQLQTRYRYLYFSIVLIDVALLGFSIFLNHHTADRFGFLLDQSKVVSSYLHLIDDVGDAVSKAGAPANDVFVDLDAKKAAKELDRLAVHSMNTLKKLSDFPPLPQYATQRQDFAKIEKLANEQVLLSRQAIEFVGKGNEKLGGDRMGKMDATTAQIQEVLYTIRRTLRDRKLSLFEDYQAELNESRAFEGFLVIFGFTCSLFVLFFGVLLNGVIERKEREVLEANERLETGARLSSIGEMASAIVHEINNPLTIIAGKAQQVSREIDSASDGGRDRIREHVKKILSMTDRVHVIIRSLKSYVYGGEAEEIRESSFKQIVEEAIQLIEPKLKRSQVRLIQGPVPDLNLDCRPVQISQVFINLLGNACDAVASKPDAWVRTEFNRLGDTIEIKVTDSGPGIPPAIVDQMMNPFFTTKEKGVGTGLGLSIVRKIIHAHHGIFRYNSEYPNTQFVITIPLRYQPVVPTISDERDDVA